MSKYISTVDDKVHIISCADHEGFGLSVMHKDKGNLGYTEFSWDKYGPVLRKLWEDYLKEDKKPILAGHTLSDNGFVTETMHYIAPNSFTGPAGPVLPKERELCVRWLKTQLPKIHEKIGRDISNNLNEHLDWVLETNLKRKKR